MVTLVKVERLRKLELSSDCPHICEDDDCRYLFEYVSGQKGPPYSPGNQLIRNFKKEMSRKKSNPYEWQYKLELVYSPTFTINFCFISYPIVFSPWLNVWCVSLFQVCFRFLLFV